MSYTFHHTLSALRSRLSAAVVVLRILTYFVTHTSVIRPYYRYNTGTILCNLLYLYEAQQLQKLNVKIFVNMHDCVYNANKNYMLH